MCQVSTTTREFTWEFKQHAQDLGVGKNDAKVYFISALNQDTLSCLNMYVTMGGGNEKAYLESVQDGLHCVPYIQMLAYLK